MKDYILKAENVFFQYEDGHQALNGISLGIEKGKKTVILGSNGAGKSTLFLHFNGVYKPSKGIIKYKNKEVTYKNSYLKNLRKDIGIVFQDPDTQLFSANVFQEISFGPLNLGLSKEEAQKRVLRAMEQTGITHLKDRPTHLLSYGEKKRVAIADVLAMDPEVIIFDEPTAWLDPISTKNIMQLLDKINSLGKTLLLSTHDVDLAYSWADCIVVVKRGNVIGEGTPQEIFRDEKFLREAGMIRPLVLEIYYELLGKGVINKNAEMPRNKRELLNLIRGDKEVEDGLLAL